MLFKKTAYIRFSSEIIQLRYVEKEIEISDKPIVAINKNTGQVIGIGARAEKERAESIDIVNPFDHPRTFLSDFDVAGKLLSHFLLLLMKYRIVRPVIILHPLKYLEGGLTQIESRALLDLGKVIGARAVHVLVGPEPNNNQLLNLDFFENNETLG